MMRHLIASLCAACLLLGAALAFGQGNQQPMTNADVIKMVQSGMSEDAIIAAIKAATPGFDLTNEGMAAVRQQKIPEKVVLAMIRRQWEVNSVKHKTHAPGNALEYKWEIEVHGGFPGKYDETSGWVDTPTAETYSLVGSGAKGYWGKRVSSWYFGDGAELLGMTSSLDTVLSNKVVEPKGIMYGARVTRNFTRLLGAEISLDQTGRYALTKDTLSDIEAVRAGFEKSWSRLSVPGNTAATSISSISPNGGRQTFLTGAVVFSLPESYHFKPYLTAGAGLLFVKGDSPTITLSGAYGGPNALETDTVRLSFSPEKSLSMTGVAGAGFKIFVTKHWGIRFDARAYLYRNHYTTFLDSNHTNTPNAAWIVKAADADNNSVAFLQQLSGPGASAYTSLSGPALSRFRARYGSGMQHQIPITMGLFYRF
jgi:hypothetical protein